MPHQPLSNLFTTQCGIAAIVLAGSFLTASCSPTHEEEPSPWPNWKQYRETVRHPAGVIKADDLVRAKRNLAEYEWARQYLAELKGTADRWLPAITPAFLEQMIPDTTPGGMLFTPCPACRELGKPYLPHGNWSWEAENPERLVCKSCKTVFPHDKYPESITVRSTWGKSQTLTFVGGEPFPIFSYETGRPSLTGCIRAHKATWMADLVSKLGETYALTNNIEYAETAKMILLRFAKVYPYWLVHVGYGEYADMEPDLAAQNIEHLSTGELVYPPNKPDGKLHTGFWTAGRSRGEGMEGVNVRSFTSAYDLTCEAKAASGKALYSNDERLAIEKDLLLESAKLLQADRSLNNKSAGNRAAAALVGMVVGEPELVRFGIDGFEKTLATWFLPDGSTPESPAYSMMTLSGIADLGQALRQYSDPTGYSDSLGKRFDQFDPYRETAYERVWSAHFAMLQGDLNYPPFADSYRDSRLGSWRAELMTSNYPEKTEYQALLAAYIQGDPSRIHAPYALYWSEPGREQKEPPSLVLPSRCLPDLRMGFMRSGVDGRESLLLLSASDWGAHHHKDSLNLYYWKQGHELLTDLGYLWDHPEKENTVRTVAHNTVLIDGQDQRTWGRGGTVHYFLDTSHVRSMRASSNAYAKATLYERASTLVDHGNGNNYVVDLFWVKGGKVHDYVYHGPHQRFTVLSDAKNALSPATSPALYSLKNVREVPREGDAPVVLQWEMGEGFQFSAWNLLEKDETAYIGDGWGQRDHKNSDRGRTIPYIVRRAAGAGPRAFLSVFEGHRPGKNFVRNVTRLPVEGDQATALQIETPTSRDYVVLSLSANRLKIKTPDGVLETNALLTVVSVESGKIKFSTANAGEWRLSGSE